jgi:hypothetical protein
MVEKAGIEKETYRWLHILFSSHVHGLPMSYFRMGGDNEERGRGLPSPIEEGYTSLCLSMAATQSARSILLVGATGVFGRRLARQLAAMDGVALTVTSRDASRAESLADKLRKDGAMAEITALPFDNRGDLPKFASLAPWLVIDASGPFQGGDYSLARASLEAGANYVDLADARDHVL